MRLASADVKRMIDVQAACTSPRIPGVASAGGLQAHICEGEAEAVAWLDAAAADAAM